MSTTYWYLAKRASQLRRRQLAGAWHLIQLDKGSDTAAIRDEQQLFKSSAKGRFAWIDDQLVRYPWACKLRTHIMQAGSSTPVSELIMSSMGLALAAYLVGWILLPLNVIAIGLGVAVGLCPYGVITLKRARRIKAFNAVLPDAIDMLARALRAGYSMVGAIEMVSENAREPLASEFREVFKQQNLGMPLREALLLLLERVPVLDLRVLVTAVLVQKDTGGNLAEILDRTVFVIRERMRIQGEIRTHTAQGRLTAWILSGLPIAMFLLLNCLNPGYSAAFLHDPIGRKLIYISLGLLTVGSLTIRHIINGIEV